MTALNSLQTNDAIHLFSDGAFIDPRTNRMVATGQKVFAFPQARCAIGISGPMDLCRSLSTAGLLCETIDQVVSDVEAILPELIKIVLDGWPPLNCGVYIGGFSAEGERQFYKLDAKTTDRTFKFIRCDADCWNYSPALTRHSIVLALGENKADEFDRGFVARLENSDPIAHGMLALEAQRRVKVSDATLAGGSAYTVGAFAQVTSVYADRIESRILKRWPDRVGTPIAPDGAKVQQFVFGKMSYQPRQAIGFKGANDTANRIYTTGSSGYTVNETDGYVAPTVTTGSVVSDGTGTAFGNMTSNGGLAAAFSGADAKTGTNSATTASGTITGYIGKDFSSAPKAINSVTVYSSSDLGFDGTSTATTISITLYGSQTSPSSATDGTILGSTGSFADAASISKTISSNDVSTAWNYVWVVVTTTPTGVIALASRLYFFPAVVADMTLETAAQTTDSSVSNARVLLEYDNAAAPTLNTDLTVEVTCDGGSNWSTGTLVEFSSHLQDGHHGAETELVSCAPGSSVAARIKTLNEKYVPIHALTLSWE